MKQQDLDQAGRANSVAGMDNIAAPVNPDIPLEAHRRGAPKGRSRAFKLITAVAIVLVVLFAVGIYPELSRKSALTTDVNAKELTTMQVSAIEATPAPAFSTLNLPGNIDAVDQTAVIARAGGYVQQWLVDIGDKVHTGQTLAIIATPDLDQEVAQATAQVTGIRADYAQILANLSNLQAKVGESHSNYQHALAALDQARSEVDTAASNIAHARETVSERQADLVQGEADLKLADVTAKRYQNMLADGAVDQESADQSAAADDSDRAKVQALQAGIRAAQEDVNSELSAKTSAEANVKALASSVQSSHEDVVSALANVQAGQAAVAAASDNISASQANLARLTAMQGFSRVTAPFDGVITARNIDTGSLISSNGTPSSGGGSSNVGSAIAGASAGGNPASGSGGGDGASSGGAGGQSSLFSIAKLDRLRIYVNIPQADVNDIRVGQSAGVEVSQVPDKSFPGVIKRTSDALDPVSRTLVAEVRLNNESQLLRPGMFANVHIRVSNPPGTLLIPDASLITGAAGTTVAVITPDNKVHFQQVTVGRDFGQAIEITSGLTPGQELIATPSDGLHEAEALQVAGPVAKVTLTNQQ